MRLGKDIKQVIIGVNNRQLGFQCLNIPLITGAINNESIKKIYFYANPKNTANIHLLKSTVRVLQEEKKVKIVTNRRDIWNRSIYDNAIYVDDFTAYSVQTKSNLYMTHHETAMSIWEERPEAKLLWKKIVQEMSKENIVKSSPLYYEIKNNRN